MTVLAVALGGALGSALRFLVVGWVASRLGAVAYGTMTVNIIGSFIMGCVFVLLMERLGDARFAPFVMTGMLGGFTTFSAFSLDAMRMWEAGQTTAMIGYVAGSVVLSILGLALGLLAARALF